MIPSYMDKELVIPFSFFSFLFDTNRNVSFINCLSVANGAILSRIFFVLVINFLVGSPGRTSSYLNNKKRRRSEHELQKENQLGQLPAKGLSRILN